MYIMSSLTFCSRCSNPCYDKPGPTSVYSSEKARQRSVIRRINMKKSTPTKTWFSPFQASYQQPNAGDIPIFKVWRELTRVEGKGRSCFGK